MSPPRFVIRQLDPGRARRAWVFAILIWIGSLILAVVFSSLWLAPRLANTGASLPVSAMDTDELRKRIAVLERSEQVAKAALGELQGTLRDKDEEIAGLRADLAFYGRLVGGAKREALAVHDLVFAQVAGSNAWNFTATLTQNFKRGQETTGRLTLSVTGIRDGKLETLNWKDLAQQSADDALVAVLAKLDTYERRSKFSTWVYKFGVLHAGVAVRRQAWRHREVWLPEALSTTDPAPSPASVVEATDLSRAVEKAIADDLTSHQRRVALALIIEQVPIDVLAERLGTNRNALYKTLHDARRRLRASLTDGGYLDDKPTRSKP